MTITQVNIDESELYAFTIHDTTTSHCSSHPRRATSASTSERRALRIEVQEQRPSIRSSI
jgi:hypothetical protein